MSRPEPFGSSHVPKVQRSRGSDDDANPVQSVLQNGFLVTRFFQAAASGPPPPPPPPRLVRCKRRRRQLHNMIPRIIRFFRTASLLQNCFRMYLSHGGYQPSRTMYVSQGGYLPHGIVHSSVPVFSDPAYNLAAEQYRQVCGRCCLAGRHV